MAIPSFPTAPTNGATYVVNNQTWVYDATATAWELFVGNASTELAAVVSIFYNGSSWPARSTAPSLATVMWVNTTNTDEPIDAEVGDVLVKVSV